MYADANDVIVHLLSIGLAVGFLAALWNSRN